MSARRLTDQIWLVGGANADVHTSRFDCHQYLVHDDTSGILVDAGTGLGTDAWLRQVDEVCDRSSILGVVLTHYHADHAGGAAAAAAAGLRLFASAATADALATGDETCTSLARARDAGMYPADYALARTTVDMRLEPGETLSLGSIHLAVVDAAGHCDGHLALVSRVGDTTVLFSGDSVFAGGRVSLQALHDCRLDRYAETIIGFDGLDVDILLAGHGDPVLAHANRDLRIAADSFRRLVPPPNFLS